MTVAVETTVANRLPTPENRSPPGFTAVNGRSPQAASSVDASKENRLTESQRELIGEDTIVVAQPERTKAPTELNPEEHTTSVSPNVIAENEHDDSHSSKGKRKRSGSRERDVTPSSTGSYHSSKRLNGDFSGHSEPASERRSDTQNSPDTEAQANHRVNGNAPGGWHVPPQEDERQLVEALTMESRSLDNQHLNHLNEGPEPRYPQLPNSVAYNDGIPITPITNLASAQKQRKRVFANRTKSGCLTCRKRKKKCDEGHPTCNNCERGGFDCAGYSKPNTFPKQPSNPKGPHLLQAKNGYGEPGSSIHHQQVPQPPPPPPPHQMPLPDYNQHQRFPPRPMPMLDGHSNRPIQVDDDHQGLHRNMLPNIQESLPRTTNGFPPPPSWAPSDHHRRTSYSGSEHLIRPDFARAPPPADFARDHTKKPSPPRLPPVQQQPPPPPPPPHRGSNNANQYNNPRMTAALALQHSNFSRSPPQDHLPVPSFRTEKEKMMNSQPFNDKDSVLVADRKACKVALHKFNQNAADPTCSEAQKVDSFKQLIEPSRLKTHGHHPNPPPTGRVGTSVEVGSNFHCDYGYNILIGDEVDIRKDVTILDSAKVSIGNRCIIGPGVHIYTEDMDHKTILRPGEKRKPYARPVVIEDDVFIGGNVTILPGVTIGRGCTIGAASTIAHDTKPMTMNYSNRTVNVPMLRRS